MGYKLICGCCRCSFITLLVFIGPIKEKAFSSMFAEALVIRRKILYNRVVLNICQIEDQ